VLQLKSLNREKNKIVAVVDAFHAALVAADSTKALSHLAHEDPLG